MNQLKLTARQIARDVAAGTITAEEILRAHLARLRGLEGSVRAFITVLEDSAMTQARAIDAKRARGEKLGKLAGVPVAVKDNILIAGVETTCASKILKGYVAPYNATVIERMRSEDAVFVGKTNLDEFAMGSSTENSAFFKTSNPWNAGCVPGGSSGGSAAAVASGMCALSLGSDTGGSIRQPASFCGVVGVKPTYGLVSRYGLIAFASSLDQIGPFARNVADAALALSVIAGHDPKDSTSAERPTKDFTVELDRPMRDLKIGLPKEYFMPGLDPEVQDGVRRAVAVFEKLGAEIVEVSLPHSKYALSVYYIIAPSEASSNLARFDGIRYGPSARTGTSLESLYELSRGQGFGPEVKRRIMLGTYALSAGYYNAYYGKAQRVRTLIKNDFEKAFREVDLIATPTAPTPAFHFGAKSSDPLSMYLSDIFTIPCNLAGIAGISVPCGLSRQGLPIGLQLLSNTFNESLLFAAGHAYEKAAPFPEPAHA